MYLLLLHFYPHLHQYSLPFPTHHYSKHLHHDHPSQIRHIFKSKIFFNVLTQLPPWLDTNWAFYLCWGCFSSCLASSHGCWIWCLYKPIAHEIVFPLIQLSLELSGFIKSNMMRMVEFNITRLVLWLREIFNNLTMTLIMGRLSAQLSNHLSFGLFSLYGNHLKMRHY